MSLSATSCQIKDPACQMKDPTDQMKDAFSLVASDMCRCEEHVSS
ncbi:unnamed protein product [Amoebophrya sp. A120]|nr:unnamed protein product [Amoebophrya sp. A120]|eukprot:GSA120T00025336001.1